jgi:hypothetical protein
MLMHLAITFVYGMWMQGCKREKGKGGRLFIDDKETCNGWCGFSLPKFLLQDGIILSLGFHSNGDVNN